MQELAFSFADQILIYAIFAMSLNLLLGYTGQVSVAHAAFGAVGGYTVAYLFLHGHTSLVGDVAAGVGVAVLIGLVIAVPALRLTTEWLILLTLAVQTIIIMLTTTVNALGGSYGLQNITGLTVGKTVLSDPSQFIWPIGISAVVTYFICWRMGESPFGRVLRGIREDEIATRSLGKNVFLYKLTVFGVTSGMAGLAGAMLVLNAQIASPQDFGFEKSSAMVAMVIIGGAGNLFGSVLGVILLGALEPLLNRVLHLSPDQSAIWSLIAYGIVLIIILMVRPVGILPDSVTRRLRKLQRVQDRERRAATGSGSQAASVPVAPVVKSGAVATNGASKNGHASGNGSTDVKPAVEPGDLGDVELPRALGIVEHAAADSPIVLETSGITKRFGGITAAENLAITLRKGTITALVGPNGAGKTTVFNLITGAIKPDSGSVKLLGREVVGLTPDEVTRLGMVRSYQTVRIFPRLSALENVMLGIQHQPGERLTAIFFRPITTQRFEKEARARAIEWLSFVGMEKYKDVPAGALAFGQQKLVALARVLATEAEVLLLDEPASGIDVAWVDAMLGLIEQVRERGRTVCIVEHNLHVVERLADYTYFMELGRITAQGNFAELTADPRLAEAYFGTV
jgi:branched-chain amino acid transport system permease protein